MIALARVTSGLVARIHAWLPWQPCSTQMRHFPLGSTVPMALHVAEGADGTWLVSMHKEACVAVFSPDGTLLRTWGMGQLSNPIGIAVAAAETGSHAGEVVVADYDAHHVSVFDPTGRSLLRQFPVGRTRGVKDGELDRPQGVAITPGPGFSGAVEVFVTEQYKDRISVFRLSDGTFLRTWGRLGRGPGCFNDPDNVCFTEHGEVVVSDYDNHRIQVFRGDGTFLRQWSVQGTLEGQLYRPWGVATRHHEVFVSDHRNSRVQVFRIDGVFLCVICLCPNRPTGLHMCRNGTLLVGQDQSLASLQRMQ